FHGEGHALLADAAQADVGFHETAGPREQPARGLHPLHGHVPFESFASHADGVHRHAPCAQRQQHLGPPLWPRVGFQRGRYAGSQTGAPPLP
ncbi:MAG: hypothetical protein ACK559_23200, partial [bacterium]